MDGLISFTAIVFTFGSLIAFIFIIAFYSYKTKHDKFKVLEKSIETGQSLPPEFFEPQKKNTLFKGILLTMTGIGLFIAFYFRPSGSYNAYFGFIPFLLGIGYLIIHFIEQKNQKKQDSAENE